MHTTAIINIEALRCDCITTNINITGAKNISIGLKNPSFLSSNLSLLSDKYEAKNTTKAILATSDGWKLIPGTSIQRLAPPCSAPTFGISTAKRNIDTP